MNGILNVYKEAGYTSHDVINRLRRICNQKKIGHTGTLDPNAEGVLPVCFGNATKVCGILTDTDKVYRAEIILGLETDSYDITGTAIHEMRESTVSDSEFRQAVSGFIGNQMQIPPMYSARKVNGQKLYQLARQGITIEREAKEITIQRIDIVSICMENHCVKSAILEIECTKGTYIRSICHDIGQVLGIGACMGSLTRTRVGSFQIEESQKLYEIEQKMLAGKLADDLIPADKMFSYPKIQILGEEPAKLLRNGNKLPIELLLQSGAPLVENDTLRHILMQSDKSEVPDRFLVYDVNGRFSAIYEYQEKKKELVPLTMFPEC